MIRLFRVYYPARTLVLLAGDAVGLVLSFSAATLMQFGSASLLVLQYEFGLTKILIFSGFMLLSAHYLDLYSPGELSSTNEVFVRLYALLGIASIALSSIAFFWPELVIGNNTFFYGTVFATGALSGWRWFFTWALSRHFLQDRVYVLGDGQRAQRLVSTLRKRIDMGMEVVGRRDASPSSPVQHGSAKSLLDVCRRARVNRVIVALDDRRGQMPLEELIEVRLDGIIVEDATALLEKITGRLEVSDLTKSCLIFTDGFKVSHFHEFCMRVASVTFAVLVLVVAAPVMLLIALLIRYDSPGSPLFIQKRVGHFGKTFKLLKFRSMHLGSEGAAPVDRNDPRFTRIGKLLRRTRLDELPQMINVLKGDMNLVGPRPFVPAEENVWEREIPFYSLRWKVKPGITGWAQIRRGYNRTLEENTEKLAYDLFYIKNASLSLDLVIMFETAKIVFLRRGSR